MTYYRDAPSRAEHAEQVYQENRRALAHQLGLLPFAVVHRLNVAHLSTGMGDHHYVWRLALPGRWGSLVRFKQDRVDGTDGLGEFVCYVDGRWQRLVPIVRRYAGYQFIRMGQVI